LQYGAIRFARHKKALFGAIRQLRAIKRLIWRDSPFTRRYTLDWRDSSQSCGGERNLPSASHLDSITERVFF
jgi:hypothetical protein